MAAIRDNSKKVFHKWKPIDPIDSDSQAYDFGEIDSLQRQWLHIKRQVESSTPDAYKAFTDRLTRRWSIETGIIEGIYELDRGVTETLVQQGFAADYIERNATNKEPSELVQILNDHQDSIESVNYWIEQCSPLTKMFIQSLHVQILKSQDTHTAVNQFGQRFEATLHKGQFKSQPNNPTRSDGSVHEYCPPEQVESELDNLLSMYEEYDNQDCHPLLLAAWLHHRFTQIHAFEDGNGRVGRAILTWHLVKNRYFPIVISRDDRTEYIASLEEADKGDMTRLIDLFVRLEKGTISQALSAVEADSQVVPLQQAAGSLGYVIESMVERTKRRDLSESDPMRSVEQIALVLRGLANDYLEEKSEGARWMEALGLRVLAKVSEEGPDISTDHWYRVQILKTAEELGHWVNDSQPRHLVRFSIEMTQSDSHLPRLVFAVSLHHIGRQLTGVMAATSFAQIEHHDGTEYVDPIQGLEDLDNWTFKNCASSPFAFTWSDSIEEISASFIRWTERCFDNALMFWSAILTQSVE